MHLRVVLKQAVRRFGDVNVPPGRGQRQGPRGFHTLYAPGRAWMQGPGRFGHVNVAQGAPGRASSRLSWLSRLGLGAALERGRRRQRRHPSVPTRPPTHLGADCHSHNLLRPTDGYTGVSTRPPNQNRGTPTTRPRLRAKYRTRRKFILRRHGRESAREAPPKTPSPHWAAAPLEPHARSAENPRREGRAQER